MTITRLNGKGGGGMITLFLCGQCRRYFLSCRAVSGHNGYDLTCERCGNQITIVYAYQMAMTFLEEIPCVEKQKEPSRTRHGLRHYSHTTPMFPLFEALYPGEND